MLGTTHGTLSNAPECQNIGHKYVFAHKYDEKGYIVRYKTRLVALGCLQTHHFDLCDTYSPVAFLNTIRVFLSVCCSIQYVIQQFDVVTSFLVGDSEEEAFMDPPVGVEIAPGMVCK